MPSLNPSPRWRVQVDGRPIAVRWGRAGTALVATAEGIVHCFDASGEALWKVDVGARGCCAMDAAPDGSRWVSGHHDGTVVAWDRNTSERTERVGRGWVEHVAFDPTGRRIAAASGRHLVVVPLDRGPATPPVAHPSTVAALQWSPSGDLLACAGYGGVWMHDTSRSQCLQPGMQPRLLAWKGSMISLAWDPRGRHIACGCQDASVHFWRWPKGDDSMMTGYARKPKALAWSGDGRWLATAGGELVTLWGGFRDRGPERTDPIDLPGHTAPVDTLAFARTHARLVSGARDGRLIVYRFGRDNRIELDHAMDGAVDCVRFSADDRSLLVASASGEVRVWGAA
jgi:WD40 repeat protein